MLTLVSQPVKNTSDTSSFFFFGKLKEAAPQTMSNYVMVKTT